jgi:hypothetical protein
VVPVITPMLQGAASSSEVIVLTLGSLPCEAPLSLRK